MSNGSNAAALRQTQLGIQNTAGTAVGANILQQSRGIIPVPVEPTEMRRAMGRRVATAQVGMRGRHTAFTLEGYMSFLDEVYTLSNMLGNGTVATPSGGTLTRDWTFLLPSLGCLSPKRMSFENGVDCSGFSDWSRFCDGTLNSLTYDFDAMQVGGGGIGGRLAEEGVTATASPTTLADVPISPDLLNIYVDDDLSDLFTTSNNILDDVYQTRFEINNLRVPRFPGRSSAPLVQVETPVRCFVHLEMEHGTPSHARMQQLRSRVTRYIGIEILGPTIESAFAYRFRLTLAVKATNPGRANSDDMFKGMYDLEAVHDANIGGFGKFEIRNTLTALASATNLASGQQPGGALVDDTFSGLVPPTP